MPRIPQYPALGQRTQLSPLVISLRREGEEWTSKFDPEVFQPDNAGQEWREMGCKYGALLAFRRVRNQYAMAAARVTVG